MNNEFKYSNRIKGLFKYFGLEPVARFSSRSGFDFSLWSVLAITLPWPLTFGPAASRARRSSRKWPSLMRDPSVFSCYFHPLWIKRRRSLLQSLIYVPRWQITKQQIWIMIFGLRWNIERFMNPVDGLDELRTQGGSSDNYREDGCKVHVTPLITFYNKSRRNVRSSRVYRSVPWRRLPAAKRNIWLRSAQLP